MDNQQLLAHIAALTGSEPNAVEDTYGMLNVHLETSSLLRVVEGLKTKHQFIYLTDICASHYPDRVGAEFEVIKSINFDKVFTNTLCVHFYYIRTCNICFCLLPVLNKNVVNICLNVSLIHFSLNVNGLSIIGRSMN